MVWWWWDRKRIILPIECIYSFHFTSLLEKRTNSGDLVVCLAANLVVIIIIIITLYPFPPHHDVCRQGKVGTHPQYCAKSKLGRHLYILYTLYPYTYLSV